MPRISRAVAVGYPHHITQRGNYRQTIFTEADDYAHYMELLRHYARIHHLEIWAYCLMPNHWHLQLYPRQNGDLEAHGKARPCHGSTKQSKGILEG